MTTSLIRSIPSDEKEFEAFFNLHYPVMVGFAMNYLKDKDQAEELVQDVFTNVWIKAETITISTSAKSYLFTATRNACLNFLKHQKIEMAYANQYESPLSQTANELEYDELVGRLEKALDKIPEKCREIFELNRFEGKRYKEIAEELNLSLKTVENQMGKALKILRNELGDYLPLILWLWLYGGKF
ncbi:RNA polymerase sigma-70 factor [Marinoscillum pacificum]|uniref:RNA polymerase sigma-70 factor n=1 Tax=Marinoscillum pacificum TaxID=392723 RepID=UPI0021574146|nr:RNA polymerase sigma-70 factor [Marinoscillum pacificum]